MTLGSTSTSKLCPWPERMPVPGGVPGVISVAADLRADAVNRQRRSAAGVPMVILARRRDGTIRRRADRRRLQYARRPRGRGRNPCRRCGLCPPPAAFAAARVSVRGLPSPPAGADATTCMKRESVSASFRKQWRGRMATRPPVEGEAREHWNWPPPGFLILCQARSVGCRDASWNESAQQRECRRGHGILQRESVDLIEQTATVERRAHCTGRSGLSAVSDGLVAAARASPATASQNWRRTWSSRTRGSLTDHPIPMHL